MVLGVPWKCDHDDVARLTHDPFRLGIEPLAAPAKDGEPIRKARRNFAGHKPPPSSFAYDDMVSNLAAEQEIRHLLRFLGSLAGQHLRSCWAGHRKARK